MRKQTNKPALATKEELQKELKRKNRTQERMKQEQEYRSRNTIISLIHSTLICTSSK
jgi:hypothetical protein